MTQQYAGRAFPTLMTLVLLMLMPVLGLVSSALLFGGEGEDGAGGVHLRDGKFPNNYPCFAGQDPPRRQQDVLRLRSVSHLSNSDE